MRQLSKREHDEISANLGAIRNMAEELHVLLFDSYPRTAEKMQKIGRYVGKLATCIRVHGQLPLEPDQPSLVTAAKIIHKAFRD